MKEIGKIAVGAMLGVLIMLIVMAIAGRMNRSVEVQSNLSNVVETTLRQAKEVGSIHTEEEMLADCVMSLVSGIDSKSTLRVNIMGMDVQKGVLSMQALEEFQHINGEQGSTKVYERTAIWDMEQEDIPSACEITFFLSQDEMREDSSYYKKYVIQYGERIAMPAIPQVEGKSFVCWKDANDYMADFSIPVEQNLIYYAEWN